MSLHLILLKSSIVRLYLINAVIPTINVPRRHSIVFTNSGHGIELDFIATSSE